MTNAGSQCSASGGARSVEARPCGRSSGAHVDRPQERHATSARSSHGDSTYPATPIANGTNLCGLSHGRDPAGRDLAALQLERVVGDLGAVDVETRPYDAHLEGPPLAPEPISRALARPPYERGVARRADGDPSVYAIYAGRSRSHAGGVAAPRGRVRGRRFVAEGASHTMAIIGRAACGAPLDSPRRPRAAARRARGVGRGVGSGAGTRPASGR
jgi:hypothetical protein